MTRTMRFVPHHILPRYFERLAAIVRPKRIELPEVLADAEGLLIGEVRVPWGEIRRLDAYKRDIYVGDLLSLVVFSSGGRVFEINEESPGWNEIGEAIEHYLQDSLPFAEWTFQLIAAKPGEAVAIFPVNNKNLEDLQKL